MKRFLILGLSIAVVSAVQSQSLYNQLCDFNFNWKKYAGKAPGHVVHFNSDQALIQSHLTNVIKVLRSNPTDFLSEAQLNSRIRLIDKLEAYRKAGQFPQNYFNEIRTPVFIDPNGTHCAVGYLIRESGNPELALQIAKSYNYKWVKDIHNPKLLAWQKASGFTLEELKLIQGAYDYYMPDAFTHPNRFEIPQKPEVRIAYFDNDKFKKDNVWFKGEGKADLLHGRWEQYAAPGKIWIVGHYQYGKRTGMWEEYYQGTDKLCRTEHWRDDELNGIRKRWDRSGKLIETILFENGEAVLKTNFDHTGLIYERIPIDSNTVQTKVYTKDWMLIASGVEEIHNPENLMWFQNIELTALNSAAIKSRDVVDNQIPDHGFTGSLSGHNYASPKLVEYKKTGEWKYYPEMILTHRRNMPINNLHKALYPNFQVYAGHLYKNSDLIDSIEIVSEFDSLTVHYVDNHIVDLIGHNEVAHFHLHYNYDRHDVLNLIQASRGYYSQYDFTIEPAQEYRLASCGRYDENGHRIGTWKYFDNRQKHIKSETYIVPWKEEQTALLSER